MFEGEDSHKVPKKDWSFEDVFELVGMLIAHSLLQDGPGLLCLSPSVYTYLVSAKPL